MIVGFLSGINGVRIERREGRVCVGERRGGVSTVVCVGGGVEMAQNLSRLVGYGIVVGSVLYKVPQLVRIVRSGSSRGISAAMYSLDTVGTGLSAAYAYRMRFPVSAVGELYPVLTTNVAIMGLLYQYGEPRERVMLVLVLVVGVIGAWAFVLRQAYSVAAFQALQLLSIPVVNISRIPQIWRNFRRQSTGELAPSTLFLAFIGSSLRMITTRLQLRDSAVFHGFLFGSLFNLVLLLQVAWYRKINHTAA
mmetsp:Transcript_15618/g.31572  ORF Transcript_15618/g.31572 Transcript_15618/m.31572 type:complete len:250 (+) Transcript_15618:109-858(+)